MLEDKKFTLEKALAFDTDAIVLLLEEARSRAEDRFARFLNYHRKEEIDVAPFEEQDMELEALEKAVVHIEATCSKPEVRWGVIKVISRGGVLMVGDTC